MTIQADDNFVVKAYVFSLFGFRKSHAIHAPASSHSDIPENIYSDLRVSGKDFSPQVAAEFLSHKIQISPRRSYESKNQCAFALDRILDLRRVRA
jgi:hypothetical protein